METVFNVNTNYSVLATSNSGPDNVGTVTSTTKTNSYSSYLVSLFNDIELDSFTIFTLAGDDVITLDAKNDYALAYFYTGSGDDVIRIINEVGTGTYGRIINLWAQGGSGNDELHGGAGGDELKGNSGNDLIYGGGGDDFLYGDCQDYDFQYAIIILWETSILAALTQFMVVTAMISLLGVWALMTFLEGRAQIYSPLRGHHDFGDIIRDFDSSTGYFFHQSIFASSSEVSQNFSSYFRFEQAGSHTQVLIDKTGSGSNFEL